MFFSTPAYAVVSFIEHAIMELALADAQTENAWTNMRTRFKRSIKDARMNEGQGSQDTAKPMITNYIQPTEEGYPGLEPPVG